LSVCRDGNTDSLRRPYGWKCRFNGDEFRRSPVAARHFRQCFQPDSIPKATKSGRSWFGERHALQLDGMNASSRRRQRVPLAAALLCALVLLTSAERRLAYLDFNPDHGVRIENSEKPDGDEIINRLIFVDDAAEVIVPAVGDACDAAPVPVESCARSLIAVRLSESRAPPLPVQPQV